VVDRRHGLAAAVVAAIGVPALSQDQQLTEFCSTRARRRLPQSMGVLNEVARLLKYNASLKLEIDGSAALN